MTQHNKLLFECLYCGACRINTSLSTTSKILQENAVVRWGAILIWIAIAVLCLGLYTIAIVSEYHVTLVPCEGAEQAWQVNGGCGAYQVSPSEAEILNSWGISLQQFALYIMTVYSVITPLFLILAFLILWRQGTSLLGLTVSLALIVTPLTTYASGTIWANIHPALEIPGVIGVILGNLIQLTFLYLIPNGRFSPSWSKYILFPGLIGVCILVLFANNLITIPEAMTPVLFTVAMIGVVASIVLQVYRYFSDSTQEERQQTKLIVASVGAYFSSIFVWVMFFGGAAGIQGGAPRLLSMMISTPIVQLLILALPVGITMAILRYNLWNIDIAINRSVVGIIVTVILGLVFAAGIGIVQVLLNAPNPIFGFAVSAIGPILLFNPTRKRVRHFIDRRLYGFAFDLDELKNAQEAPHITNPGTLSGKTLGDYTVLDVIGKGGMGEVYKGQGKQRIVAIKTMLPEIAADSAMRKRFLREAEIGKTLEHPSIAAVYDNGVVDDMPYLVMEYIDGVDISHQLKTGDSFDIETAITIMTQICEALDVAHERGYVHRDIKPANVMLRQNGAAVLMDFGLIKVEDASVKLTGTGAIGTIYYMAPEQIMASKDVQHYADIYALGVMLYEMLIGEPPFTGSAAQVMFAHLQQPAPDPRDQDDHIPDELADSILCALEKDPLDRFASAGAFAAALQIALNPQALQSA